VTLVTFHHDLDIIVDRTQSAVMSEATTRSTQGAVAFAVLFAIFSTRYLISVSPHVVGC
jgi:hypothetical protein